MVGMVEKINEMHARFGQLSEVINRVDQMDQRLANVEKMLNESRRRSVVDNNAIDANKLAKTYDAVTTKMTLLETELLIIKQVGFNS